jgi:hypothetical protein
MSKLLRLIEGVADGERRLRLFSHYFRHVATRLSVLSRCPLATIAYQVD